MELTKTTVPVAIIGGFIMTFSWTFYHPNTKTLHENGGILATDVAGNINTTKSYYGVPTGDFDWCEYNNLYSIYINEVWNSLSSLAYSAFAIMDAVFYIQCVPNTNMHVLCALFCQFLVGIGSVSFHSTLQYEQQLMDEIPMQMYVTTWFVYAYCRHSSNKQYWTYSIALFTLSLLLIVATMVLDRDNIIHIIAHSLIMITFGLFMLCDLIISAFVFQECKAKKKRGYEVVGQYAKCSFFAALIGCILWQCDNLCCDFLQNLPFNLPYPHFHTLWHLGTAISCHYYFMTFSAYDTIYKYDYGIVCDTLFGVPAYFAIKSVDDKKSK